LNPLISEASLVPVKSNFEIFFSGLEHPASNRIPENKEIIMAFFIDDMIIV